MAEGSTKTKVTDDDIRAVFDRRAELGQPVFTASNLAEILSADIDGDTISAERIRQRIQKLDGITGFKLGPRTVVYGRDDDPAKVSARAGTLGLIPTVLFGSAVLLVISIIILFAASIPVAAGFFTGGLIGLAAVVVSFRQQSSVGGAT